MTQESKKRAIEKYAKLRMKIIEVYNRLPDPEDDTEEEENSESSQGEKSEGEKSEEEKYKDESSEADADACTHFM